MQQMKWHCRSTLLLVLVLISNIRHDITAETVLGLEAEEESHNFETCQRNDEERLLPSKAQKLTEKKLKDKQLFLSEGGW